MNIGDKPGNLRGKDYCFDSFKNGEVLLGKKKNILPTMGWNSWNAFGSGNTEKLTKEIADKLVELGLDKLGYKYIVLDDGCYKSVRIDDKITNEEDKFPSGFKSLAKYIHDKDLKFGMYNDIGTNLCAGANVGTCGYEEIDAKSYVEWDIDFIKVDNCYYPWDNATFSDAKNARFVFAPNVKSIEINGKKYDAENDGRIIGNGPEKRGGYVSHIGTFDGTGPIASPTCNVSGELVFDVEAEKEGYFDLFVEYATDALEGAGSWLQVAVGDELFYDDLVEETESPEDFIVSKPISVFLKKGNNSLRIMNHRRQENTLNSYATFLEGLNKAKPNHDIILSICEWGKTHPQDWGYKVGDSWRILNDITFRVGSENDPGHGDWYSEYTTSITSQYNKAVIMDEYAGLSKGWNDPDMLMIGMNGLDMTMCKTHMSMWCMMNSPLMLGLDLRKVNKDDEVYSIISNKELISFNQDKLGIQAKRVYCSLAKEDPSKEYVRDINRVDILVKPLCDKGFAISYINVSDETKEGSYFVDVDTIEKYFPEYKFSASEYKVTDVWSKEESKNTSGKFSVSKLLPHESITIKVTLNE